MSQQTTDTSATTPLAKALEQNESVKETIEQSANELFVINAVLKQELPDTVQTGEVAQALRKTDALENQIQESAGDIAQVNQALEQEIGERVVLERELVKTKAALDRAKEQLSAP